MKSPQPSIFSRVMQLVIGTARKVRQLIFETFEPTSAGYGPRNHIALECRQCGYDMSGLGNGTACPECGISDPLRSPKADSIFAASTIANRGIWWAYATLSMGAVVSLIAEFSVLFLPVHAIWHYRMVYAIERSLILALGAWLFGFLWIGIVPANRRPSIAWIQCVLFISLALGLVLLPAMGSA